MDEVLDERKRKILKAIIKTYMETGEPVGSRTISKYPDLNVSSATIRNEMSDLTDMGYIVQPHTSAGRIPSDKGYRLYVDELMKENKLGDGKMFKLDFDPRVIGNQIMPDGSHKTGIGEFIRRTSLDEFPQFFNVLKGDMSLVGTRPPLISETNLYELHHKARLAIKPGITGMWQVSGRSEITDFEEVVRLDREYITNWNIGMDIKILMKTVMVVLRKDGAA